MTKNLAVALPSIGSPFEGGFFAGEYVLDGVRIVLVVAPISGEKLEVGYKIKDFRVSDKTDSDDDGMLNSGLINDEYHPAAQFCRSLRVGGFDDWYLPSRDELMHIWMNLGPNRQKTPEAFKAGGEEAFENNLYWSSTEYASNPYYAWLVGFYNGYQTNTSKVNVNAVRAVRRLSI